MNFKNKMFAIGSAVVGGLSLFASNVFAAADEDVLAAASTTALTIKENVVGAITENIATILVGGVLILVILVVWRFSKRFVSGR